MKLREAVVQILAILRALPDEDRLDVLALVCRVFCDTNGRLRKAVEP